MGMHDRRYEAVAAGEPYNLATMLLRKKWLLTLDQRVQGPCIGIEEIELVCWLAI
jgi:hypothetical protein